MASAKHARWTKELRMLKAISIRQPWAWLVVSGQKDIENRSWRTHYRGPLLVHSGMSHPDLNEGFCEELEEEHGLRKLPKVFYGGGIIGVVNVVDCVRRSKSPWFSPGDWGWVLADARTLPFRECKGKVGLFRPDI